MTRQAETSGAEVPEPETTLTDGSTAGEAGHGESTDGAERPGATAGDDQDAEGAQEATGRTRTASPGNAWDRDREAAREAGRRGGAATAAARRRDREAAELAGVLGREGAAEGLAASQPIRTSAADADVIAALRRDAKRGDVAAARELREWQRLDQAQGAGQEALSLALLATQLPSTLLAALRSTVLDLVRASQAEGERPAQEQNREGSDEADRSLPLGAAALAEPEATPRSDGTPSLSTARTPQTARDSGNDPQIASDTTDPPDTTI